jgi:starch-binding outer membrane protein SusE/F
MKYNYKSFLAIIACLITFAACKKVDNTFFPNGKAVILSTSVTTVAAKASDSANTVLILNWTNPKYATDSALQKFVIEMDSSGRNFAQEVTFIVNGSLTASLTAKQVNDALLEWGFEFNKSYPIDIRVTSSYANNNEQYRSNIITVQMTPYKIPPKIKVPAKLYIIGGATPGGWSSGPVPVPSQQMTQIDSVTFGAILYLSSGNGGYDLLPVNGSWDNKYNIADATIAGAGVSGSFQGVSSGGSDFPAPETSGYYTLIFNFQSGTYSVTPYHGTLTSEGTALPTNLYIIGGATPNGWNQPVPVPSQQFTQLSNAEFQITIPLSVGNGGYDFLPLNGSWNEKYNLKDASVPGAGVNGIFQYAVSGGSDFPAPSAPGTYLIDVNFITGKYTVTPH